MIILAFEKINDPRVRKLAQTLRDNGLACSDSEAERMATEMTCTEQKIQQSFDEQKSNETKEKIVEPQIQPEQVSRLEPSEPKLEGSDVKPYYDNKAVDLDPNKTVSELMSEDASAVYADKQPTPEELSAKKLMEEEGYQEEPHISETEPVSVQESESSVSEISKPEPQSEFVSESVEEESDITISDAEPKNDFDWTTDDSKKEDLMSESEPVAEAESTSEPEQESESEPEPEEESEPEPESDEKDEFGQGETGQPKPGAEKMPESTIDLSDVFNFSKK